MQAGKESTVVGTKQTLKALKNGQIVEVIIAEDADRRVTDKVLVAAQENNVKVTKVKSMKRLGKICGIDVGAATVAIKG